MPARLTRRLIGRQQFEVRLQDGSKGVAILDQNNRVVLLGTSPTGFADRFGTAKQSLNPFGTAKQSLNPAAPPPNYKPQPVPTAQKSAASPLSVLDPAEDHHDRVFVGHLKSVLKDNQFNRVVRHRVRGKLDMRGLPRVATHRQDVFKRKCERKNRLYNIMMLVDESGSMSQYEKAYKAAETARFLAENLVRVDGVRFAVMGFDDGGARYHKKFDDKPSYRYAELEADILQRTGGGNDDLRAVREACVELRKQPDGVNFLFYFSDGCPSNPTGVKNYIKAQTDITTIGVGVLFDAEHIPQRIVIQNIDELKPRVLGALRAHISRG